VQTKTRLNDENHPLRNKELHFFKRKMLFAKFIRIRIAVIGRRVLFDPAVTFA